MKQEQGGVQNTCMIALHVSTDKPLCKPSNSISKGVQKVNFQLAVVERILSQCESAELLKAT